MRCKTPDPQIELASGEYDRRVLMIGKAASVKAVAAWFGVSYNKLVNYRANYISRKVRPELKAKP